MKEDGALVVVPISAFFMWMIMYGSQPNAARNAALFSGIVFVTMAFFRMFG